MSVMLYAPAVLGSLLGFCFIDDIAIGAMLGALVFIPFNICCWQAPNLGPLDVAPWIAAPFLPAALLLLFHQF
jgi:hypothetical protein